MPFLVNNLDTIIKYIKKSQKHFLQISKLYPDAVINRRPIIAKFSKFKKRKQTEPRFPNEEKLQFNAKKQKTLRTN